MSHFTCFGLDKEWPNWESKRTIDGEWSESTVKRIQSEGIEPSDDVKPDACQTVDQPELDGQTKLRRAARSREPETSGRLEERKREQLEFERRKWARRFNQRPQ